MTHQFGKQGLPIVGNPRIRAGHWYRTQSGTINEAALGQNKMTLIPFWPGYRGTLDGLAYESTLQGSSGSGTDTMRIGLYADDGQGRPTGAPLFETANQDMEGAGGTLGVHTIAVSWTNIEPTLYWLAVSRRNTGAITTSPRLRLAAADDLKDKLASDANATPAATFMGTAPIGNYEMTISADALPTISGLAIGTFVQTVLVLVKFA